MDVNRLNLLRRLHSHNWFISSVGEDQDSHFVSSVDMIEGFRRLGIQFL